MHVAALPADTTLTGGEGNVILVVNRSNNAAKHTISVIYTAQNLTTMETVERFLRPIERHLLPELHHPRQLPVTLVLRAHSSRRTS